MPTSRYDAGLAVARWSRRAEARRLVLTSLMAKLRCESFAERSHIPAFVFFFQMLYPFAWVNDPRQRDRGARPAAACWCAAMRCKQAGGIDSIRDALIDDCSLAEKMKATGPDLARPHRARRTASAPMTISTTCGR